MENEKCEVKPQTTKIHTKTTNDRNLKITVIFVGLIVLLRIFVFSCFEIHPTTDSYEYLTRDGFAWLSGKVDRYRLPIYPMLIDLFAKIFGEEGAEMLCLFQFVVSLVASLFLWQLLNAILKNKKVVFVIFALYNLTMPIFGWDKTLITESISLSFTIFILYGLVGFIKNKSVGALCLALTIAWLGAYLKAVFAIYLGFIFGFIILHLITEKVSKERTVPLKQEVGALLAALSYIALILVYAAVFYRTYGLFTLSESALGQQVSVVLQNGYYTASGDTEMVADANEILNNLTADQREGKIRTYASEMYKEEAYEEKVAALEEMAAADAAQMKQMDPEIDREIEQTFDELFGTKIPVDNSYAARFYLTNNYDVQRLQRFVRESKQAHFKDYLIWCFTVSGEEFRAYYTWPSGTARNLVKRALQIVAEIQPLRVNVVMLLALCELGYFFYRLRKHKCEWFSLGCASLSFVTCVFALFGTNAEFSRTAQTSLPIYYVMLAMWVDRLIKPAQNASELAENAPLPTTP